MADVSVCRVRRPEVAMSVSPVRRLPLGYYLVGNVVVCVAVGLATAIYLMLGVSPLLGVLVGLAISAAALQIGLALGATSSVIRLACYLLLNRRGSRAVTNFTALAVFAFSVISLELIANLRYDDEPLTNPQYAVPIVGIAVASSCVALAENRILGVLAADR
jgi:hypothetical protein